jgi:hypothetical protein
MGEEWKNNGPFFLIIQFLYFSEFFEEIFKKFHLPSFTEVVPMFLLLKANVKEKCCALLVYIYMGCPN